MVLTIIIHPFQMDIGSSYMKLEELQCELLLQWANKAMWWYVFSKASCYQQDFSVAEPLTI